MTLNSAVLAPMPSASVITATAVKPGFFSSWRKAERRTVMVRGQWSLFLRRGFSFLHSHQSRDLAASVPRLHCQQQRALEVFGRRGNFLHQSLVCSDFAAVDYAKARILDPINVVVHRVTLCSQAILHTAPF